jgi:hypothetical protein
MRRKARTRRAGIFALQDSGAWYTMTQFEALSARRAFPCFDEPGFKTPWQVTLRVPHGLVALSNTRVESQSEGADGFTTVRFARTRPLPSYLVAFAVGPWEFVDLGEVGARSTPTRIVVPRGRRADAEFAAHAYPELFTRLEKWFGTGYPFDKLDHIAIPITVNFAMENAGLITYGAPTLLAKPGATTPRFRRISASVGTHEISHQWFGDLVTMNWWDDLWLNEAFATWIADKVVDQWRPDYDRGAARIAPALTRSTPTRSSPRGRSGTDSRARRHFECVRPDHLPEGRDGYRNVRGLDRRRDVSQRRAQLYRLSPRRVGNIRGFPGGALAGEQAAGDLGVQHLPQPERRSAGRRAAAVRDARRAARARPSIGST